MDTESLIQILKDDQANFRKLSFINKGKYCIHSSGMVVSLNQDIPRIIAPVFSMPEGLSLVLYCPEPIRFAVANLVAHCFGLTKTIRERVYFKDGDMKNVKLDNLKTASGTDNSEQALLQNDLKLEINQMLERHDAGLKKLVITQEFITHLSRLLDLIKHKIDRKQIEMADVQLVVLENWFNKYWLNSPKLPLTYLKKELDEVIEEIPVLSAHDIIKQSIYQYFDL
ncbi:hypothetical protein VIBNIFTn2_120040 [Vibrio nigripulchritudo FTn2]|uniref:hypothetical protein n=1 Tax=Vibrio nigripulchritudo TaxID=28173 RepID=UPI0003B215C2|nr:hypothetical protein [Vibrio nigripulchritudo]CCN40058.1 hypothetical protein VIBNIFTn2_120040 [Vibrio nigripulchritudo FTn2]